MTTKTNADDSVDLCAGLRCEDDENGGIDIVDSHFNRLNLDGEQLARLLIWLRGRCGECGGSGYVASDVQTGELAICGNCRG